MRPRERARGVVALALGVSSLASGAAVGCIDLFHSTDFETLCDLDADAPGCADAESDSGKKLHDARADQTTLDARSDGKGTHDAKVDRSVGSDGGGLEAGEEAAPGEAAPPGTDSGEDVHEAGTADANFCNLSQSEAESAAQHACLWLAACMGIGGSNELASCYPMAILAYDCVANPNQEIRPGPVHTFWERLASAKNCTDVAAAMGSPSCSGSAGCVGNVAVLGCSGSTVTAAEFCPALGYGCTSGACTIKMPITCPGTASNCQGTVAHQCGTLSTGPADLGKDCAGFGAGACRADGGIAGCVPNDPGDACAATLAVTCQIDAAKVAVGCATGVAERINCTELGGAAGNAHVNCFGGTGPDIESTCYPAPTASGTCGDGGKSLTEFLGAPGTVTLNCAEAGLNLCEPAGSSASCQPP